MGVFSDVNMDASFFVEGTPINVSVESWQLPSIECGTSEVETGPMGIEAPGKLKAISGLQITTSGPCKEIANKVGHTNQVASFRLVGVYRRQGEQAKSVEVDFRGVPKQNSDSQSMGQKGTYTYEFACIEYYKQKIDGTTVYDLDFSGDKASVGGTDLYQDVKSKLGK